jgi:DMSO/TMAO reductase YedYZ molybdopterin-dependent catalytic subunit
MIHPEATVRLDRRSFVLASLAAAGGAVASRLLHAARLSASLQHPRLVIRNPRPLDAEAPLEALQAWRTPNDLFFVRSHFGPPATLPAHWTLTVDGEVSRPLVLDLAAIRRLPAVTVPVTLECAGNGRGLMALPSTSGVQWQRGAVGNAEWTGTRLANVLERAGLRPSAAHLWMEAADSGGPQVPRFLRSIPREVALRDALVVWEMNGDPIPLLHGGPLRLLVPGWYGMASAKWLTHVHARPSESDNNFMAKGYRFGDGSPVERMKVKSVIATPAEGGRVRAGSMRVAGVAWSGSGGIRQVDVSSDGGRSWRAARLTGADHPTAWRTWEIDVPVARPGRYAVRARATDRSGAVQPAVAATNPGGYGNNSIHEVSFNVA